MGRRSIRALAVLTAVGAVLVAAAACGQGEPPAGQAAAPPAPLRILLTDDDGWAAPGIVAMRESLRRAGNTVVEVAPEQDQSGTGAALTLKGGLAVRQPTADRDVWSVGGKPADAALVGLRSVLAGSPPDLVVSGINSGNNTTRLAIHSGTVGAAQTAVEYGVPAVAVSGPTATGGDPAQFAAAADFTTRLVQALAQQRGTGPLLPSGTLLNVNYPKVAPGAVASSVRAVPTADRPSIEIGYTRAPDGTLTPQQNPAPPASPDTDAGVVAAGGVALTDLSADPETPGPSSGVAARLAPLLRP